MGVVFKKKLDPPLRTDILDAKFSPDGQYSLMQDDSSIYAFSNDPFEFLFRIPSPESYFANFSPDSKKIRFLTAGLQVQEWSVEDEERSEVHDVTIPDGCIQTALSHDGKTMACVNAHLDLSLVDVGNSTPVLRQKENSSRGGSRMFRITFLALGLLFLSPCSFAQTTPTESQTLQALLAEVHQLRQDLQTASTAARRAQILIYRLYAQEAAVARASQRFDEAKSAVDQFQAQKKWQAIQIKQFEDKRDRAEDATERKQLEDVISSVKSQMETCSPEEQEAQSKEIELAQQLRTEQAKLDQLQDELDQLDRAVMNAAFHPPIAPQ